MLLTLSTGAVNLLFSTFHVELFRTNITFDRGGEELRETAQAQMCFTLISVLPLVAGCVQLYIWRSYTLSKDRVERIQHALCKQARRAEGEEWDEPPNTQQLHNP